MPGSHSLQSSGREVALKWGHAHLASLLNQHATVENKENSSIVMQCSSIGSLGPTPVSWLVGELAQSMDSAILPKDNQLQLSLPSVKVVGKYFKTFTQFFSLNDFAILFDFLDLSVL